MEVLHIVTVLQRLFLAVITAGLYACDSNVRSASLTGNGIDIADSAAVFGTINSEPIHGEITYHLHWDLDGLVRTSEHWQVVSDIGYTVTIESGWLSNYRITLAACVESTWWQTLLPPMVHANDGATIDSSESEFGTIENLTELSTQLWSRRPLTAHQYCRFHHLLARADETTQNKPMGVDVNRSTLILKGYAEKDGVRTIIDIRSAFAHGVLLEFNELSLMTANDAVFGTDAVQVVIERVPHAWFDGIDFASVTERQLAHQVGQQILETSHYHIRAVQ